jgi:thiol:disulfide interchange protein/DsbC/DsbD-like thiol-disulfide interchange protein
MQRLYLSVFLILLPIWASASGPVKTEHVMAELVSENVTIQPGTSFWVGLHLSMEDHWHTYWKNPGDSGLATSLTWSLPAGFTTGPIIWPTPQRILLEPLVSYAYEGEVLLMVRIDAPTTLDVGKGVDLRVRADWLVCEETCIPGGADLELRLSTASGRPEMNPKWAPRFSKARRNLPLEGVAWPTSLTRVEDRLLLEVSLPPGSIVHPEDVYFFAFEEGEIEPAAPQPVAVQDGTLKLTLTPSLYADRPVDMVHGILFSLSGFGAPVPGNAVGIEGMIEATGSSDLPVAGATTSPLDDSISMPIALGLAFLGGLILNLMPCVFPVLSIKILSFVQQAGDDRRRILRHGFVFAAGVLASFWVLAGLLIILRAGGQQLGWGYQLQSPSFIILIATVLFLLSLSLLGVFEIGGSMIGVGGGKAGSGYGGSFFTGVLATIVATPCTAPFMGSALAYALTQTAVVSLAVFTSLGLGMAAPYLLFSTSPALLRFLPPPGAWMETFKQFMAFPLLATLIWLTWVLGLQIGVDGLLRFLIGLLIFGMAAWVYGRWNQPVKAVGVRIFAQLIALGLLVSGTYVASTGTGMAAGMVVPTIENDPKGIQWVEFRPEKLQELTDSGQPVFLDFTAAWCLTCKANELVTFSSQEVRNAFLDRGIVPMKADWTTRNPEITEALARFGRTGVPLYVYYAGNGTKPTILPQIINPGIVLNALFDGGK